MIFSTNAVSHATTLVLALAIVATSYLHFPSVVFSVRTGSTAKIKNGKRSIMPKDKLTSAGKLQENERPTNSPMNRPTEQPNSIAGVSWLDTPEGDREGKGEGERKGEGDREGKKEGEGKVEGEGKGETQFKRPSINYDKPNGVTMPLPAITDANSGWKMHISGTTYKEDGWVDQMTRICRKVDQGDDCIGELKNDAGNVEQCSRTLGEVEYTLISKTYADVDPFCTIDSKPGSEVKYSPKTFDEYVRKCLVRVWQ
eukprot:gnl/MRDRNA2_/MRDRNA2_79599_c0_seq3.p1 gnl/MRDRNA2_/MRDRNA2_79599_c0~~gnl/MRDRNA2_/MRDRNA2_79599_c0_seq3.p1  ORF type:complete len:256 (+),score=50.17 gnl/MRDRNA2_/MRDRNA2_79599_c0_seq3:90-857(+)